jgi:ankyrin repeat protein
MKFPKLPLPKFFQEWQAARAIKKRKAKIEKLSKELDAAVRHDAPLEKLKGLVDKGADPGFNEAAALYSAALKDNKDAVALFIGHVSDQEALHPVLTLAIQSPDPALFDLVAPKITDIKKGNDAALLRAVECGNAHAVAVLSAAYPELKGNLDPVSFATWAAEKDHNRIFGRICRDNNLTKLSPLFLAAAQKADAKTMIGILAKRVGENSQLLINVLLATDEELRQMARHRPHSRDIKKTTLIVKLKNEKDSSVATVEELIETFDPAQQPKLLSRVDRVKKYIEEGADPAFRNSEALAYAAYYGHLECAQVLIEAGAKVTDENNRALQWAKMQKQDKVAAYLEGLIKPKEAAPTPAAATPPAA